MKLDFMEQIRSRVDWIWMEYLKNMINSKDYLNSEYLISFAFGFRFTRIMEDGSCYKYLGKNYITLGPQTVLFLSQQKLSTN